MSVLEITTTQYHDDDTGHDEPSLSSSLANVICRSSLAHAYAAHPRLGNAIARKTSDAFDLGDVVHGLLLEGEDRIVEVDAKDWRTNAAKAERDAAREAGMVPLLISQAERCRTMVSAVREELAAWGSVPALLDPSGRPEVPITWTEPNGVRCRSLLDWLHPLGLEIPTVDDVKTTSGSGSPEAWSRGSFYSFGYDVQAAFHSRGLRAVTGASRVQFRFVVLEAEPPFSVSVFEPGPDVFAVADAKVDYAIRRFGECLESGVWPGYPRRVATVELRPWDEQAWMEREERDG